MVRRKIIWTRKANIKLFEIMDFYKKRNGTSVYSIKLYNSFKKESHRLISQPFIGISTDIKEIRGLIVGNFILFYEVSEFYIIIHTVWDCSQNPDKL
jgi:hypothetical protein